MPAEYVRNYLLHGLRSTPAVLARLLRGATPEDLDRRPDPDRFTIREVIAHLADWDAIWLERFDRMAREEDPFLPGIDEGELAALHDYAHANAEEQLAKFAEERSALAAYLAGLPSEAWDRSGRREWGSITIAEQAAIVLGHDGYHEQQVIDWLTARA